MQVVPSQRLSCSFKAKPIELYRQLRILNPSPYMYFLNLDNFSIVGSSPEILTRVDNNNIANCPDPFAADPIALVLDGADLLMIEVLRAWR